MVDHVSQWLGAFLDGELNDELQRKVEAHLANCSSCQAELEELKELSSLLKITAGEGSLAPDARFSAQVALKLPRRQVQPLATRVARIGWWLVPAGILSAWVFLQAVLVVSGLVLAASQIGLLNGPLAWLSDLGGQSLITVAVSSLVDDRFGLAASSLLKFVGAGTSFGWDLVLPVLFQTALGLLFASWLAVWWVRNFSKRSM
jgi:anti-sigma factor RsiW